MTNSPPADVAGDRSIPLWLKVLYTAFVCVLVPVYWRDYGPTNFLYYCDLALLMTAAALWLESPLLASMPAVGILLPQTLWILDFLAVAGGLHVLGMTDYMFQPKIPFFTRFLSFFHFWLPLLLLWLVWRLGYDRRAFPAWSVLAWLLMLICYFLMPAPPAPSDNPNLPVNINYVYGPSDKEAQTWMPPLVFLGVMMIGMPLLLFLPAHLILQKVGSSRASAARRESGHVKSEN
jgi:hypothetical protein